MYIDVTACSFFIDLIEVLAFLILAFIAALFILIHKHSKRNVENLCQLDIYVYKRVLSGLSICIGLTYLTILLISVMMAYYLLEGGLLHVQ